MPKKISEKDLEKLQNKPGTRVITKKRAETIDDHTNKLMSEIKKAAEAHGKLSSDATKEMHSASLDQQKLLLSILKEITALQKTIKEAGSDSSAPVEYEFTVERDERDLLKTIKAKPQ